MRKLPLLALLCLAACAPEVQGNATSVTVSHVGTGQSAYPAAQAHCQKFGRNARPTALGQYEYAFDCVP